MNEEQQPPNEKEQIQQPAPLPVESVESVTPAQLVPGEVIPPAPAQATEESGLPTEEALPTAAPDNGLRQFRTASWYRDNLDWSKSNTELGKIAGVTKQRIYQLRKQLFSNGETPPPYKPKTIPVSAPEPAPDFSDITGEQSQQPLQPEQPLPQQPLVPQVNYQKMAEMSFDMSTGLLCNVFGPEWLPRPAAAPGQPGERDVMVACIEAYYKSKNLPDIPPGYMLCFMVTMYSLPRFTQPTTKEKVKGFWLWFKTKLSFIFKRRKP